MTRPEMFRGKKADLKMTLALGGALIAACALAIAASRPPGATSVRSEEPSAEPATLPTGAGEPLAAVPVVPNSQAKFSPLDIPEVADDVDLPPGHPDLGTAAPLGSVADSDPLPPGHPDIGNTASSPHGGLMAPANAAQPSSRPARPVAPARGGNAHVISELKALRQQLAGQRVRVRGEVMKVTPDVNGRAFFHVRDSSSPSDDKTVDLVATAVAPPQLGEIAIFEGTLRTNVDVGIGYQYPVLLEDATIVGE